MALTKKIFLNITIEKTVATEEVYQKRTEVQKCLQDLQLLYSKKMYLEIVLFSMQGNLSKPVAL